MRTLISLGGIANAVVVDNRADRSIRARIRDNAPHSHYALERDDIAIELEAFRRVCQRIGKRPDWSVWEAFGGSGWHTALIQALVKPVTHSACDISSDCCKSILETCPNVRVAPFDFNKLPGEPCSWYHADFNLWTFDRLRQDSAFRESFKHIFHLAKELVTFTDTTPFSFGGCAERSKQRMYIDWVNFVLRPTMSAFFGWSIVATYCWGPAAMHLLARSDSYTADYEAVDEKMEIKVISEAP